jgi:hypothetical protein
VKGFVKQEKIEVGEAVTCSSTSHEMFPMAKGVVERILPEEKRGLSFSGTHMAVFKVAREHGMVNNISGWFWPAYLWTEQDLANLREYTANLRSLIAEHEANPILVDLLERELRQANRMWMRDMPLRIGGVIW